MYINLLNKIKNAQMAGKENLKILYSKNDEHVLDILANYKFIKHFEKKGRGVKKYLDIKLNYHVHNHIKKGAIEGIKILSNPGRHLYVGYANIRPIKSGYGLLVLSTPEGIMVGKEAKRKKIGGELMFEIW
ncbi:MAG: 30S ribosomal protein S8 [Patescibacteria group bacterium]|nr:30S ribosomal protein S8 [Patescibacteria group bacterium]